MTFQFISNKFIAPLESESNAQCINREFIWIYGIILAEGNQIALDTCNHLCHHSICTTRFDHGLLYERMFWHLCMKCVFNAFCPNLATDFRWWRMCKTSAQTLFVKQERKTEGEREWNRVWMQEQREYLANNSKSSTIEEFSSIIAWDLKWNRATA